MSRFLIFPFKKSLNVWFVMPNLVNTPLFMRIRYKVEKIWDPKLAN